MFTLLFSDPEKSPRCCDICFCGEIDFTRNVWAEGEWVDMYWWDEEKIVVCQNCKLEVEQKEPVHNWREHGF